MNILSLWDEDYKKAKNVEKRIANLLRENKNETSLSSEKTTRSATIRGLLTELQEHISELDHSLHKSISSSTKDYSFSNQQNIEDRRKLINELTNTGAQLLEKFQTKTNVTIAPSEQLQIDGLPWPGQHESSPNGFQDYENLTGIPITAIHDKMYYDQEEHLGEIQGQVQTVRSVSNRIKEELDVHFGILDKTDRDVERAIHRISYIKRVLDWSNNKDQSTWSLIITFVILTIILALIVFLL